MNRGSSLAIRAVRLAALPLAAIGMLLGTAVHARPVEARYWTIGPIDNGRSFSTGMPAHPLPHRDGWYFDFPGRGGSVNYVTFRHGPLSGKKRIVMRFRIEAPGGVRIVPKNYPNNQALLTIYFQRTGDNWSGRGRFETYRWYATFRSQPLSGTGEYALVAPLDGNWTAIQTSSARSNPYGFRDALANADEVGFVLGGGDGYGHGVNATGPARLVVTDFRVE